MSVTGVSLVVLLAAAAAAAPQPQPSTPSRDDVLLGAVMLRDAAKVKTLLEQGASPDARSKENNDRTALFFAAEMGDPAIVRLLLAHGAEVTAVEKAHNETPVAAAARRGHAEVVRILLARDPDAAESVAWNAVYQQCVPVLQAALATRRIPPERLSFLLDEAERSGAEDIAQSLNRAGAVAPSPIVMAPAELAAFVGSYRGQDESPPLSVALGAGCLDVSRDATALAFVPLDPTYFVREGQRFPTLRFEVKGGRAAAVTVRDGDEWTRYTRVE